MNNSQAAPYRFVDIRFCVFDAVTVEFTRADRHQNRKYLHPTPASMDRLTRVLARQARCMGHTLYRWAETREQSETTPQGMGVCYVVEPQK